MLAIAAQASVTIQVNTAGWGDNSSANVNNMAWGIVVASDGGDFTGSFTSDIASVLNGFALPGVAPVNSGALIYDEFYFIQSQSLTSNSGPAAVFTDGYMNTLGAELDATITAGDNYGLLWFTVDTGTVGTSDFFGFQDIGSLPSDSSSINPATIPGLATFSVVPEPSTFAALAGVFALGAVVLRRRRA